MTPTKFRPPPMVLRNSISTPRRSAPSIARSATNASAPTAIEQYVEVKGDFSRYVDDPYVDPGFTREPLTDDG